MIGTTLSKYRILAELGRGGMGVVYRAEDTRLQREIALKVLPPHLLGEPGRRVRMLNEARAMAAVQHPGIAVVHEIDDHHGVSFIAMELVKGQPLSDLAARRSRSTADWLDIGVQVADALGALHASGMIHRDIKPSNVLVTGEGRARLIDFGLVKVFDRASDDSGTATLSELTAPGTVMGTAAYMAPEQIRGLAIDARSDIFSFGLMLFELLAGHPPFRERVMHEMLRAIVRSPTPRLPDLPDAFGVGDDLQRIVDTCLAKDKANRYQTIAAVAQDLRATLDRLRGRRPAAAAVGSAAIRVVLVDDEPLTRAVLGALLSAEPDLEIVGECGDGFEAVKAVSELRPDLLFLDVQMPRLDGFEVAELVGRDVSVIFVTAHDEYAVRALEVHAVDYVVKPVEPERLREAIQRVRDRLRRQEPAPRPGAAGGEARGEWLDRILVRRGSRVLVIPADRIDYVSAEGGRVLLMCGGDEYLKDQPLDELQARLDPVKFVRIGEDTLVNVIRMSHVDDDEKEGTQVVMRDGTRLPVSPEGLARLEKLL